MSVERTFSIIKPDAVAAERAGEILAMIQKAGLKWLALAHDALSPTPRLRGSTEFTRSARSSAAW